jgi:hypothetical protein
VIISADPTAYYARIGTKIHDGRMYPINGTAKARDGGRPAATSRTNAMLKNFNRDSAADRKADLRIKYIFGIYARAA